MSQFDDGHAVANVLGRGILRIMFSGRSILDTNMNLRKTRIVVSRQFGFFSNVYSVLGALDHCEKTGETPVIHFSCGPYHDPARGGNWWDHFFEPTIELSYGPSSTERKDEEAFAANMALSLLSNRYRCSELIQKYIRPRDEIRHAIDAFWHDKIGHAYTIGLHIRGTDKFREVLPVPEDLILQTVERVAGNCRDDWRLFVATDEQQILEKIKNYFGSRVVHQDAIRSLNGDPIHTPDANTNDPYRLGCEAIFDAYCLARSNIFVGCQSNLSLFSAAIDSSLPWINMVPNSEVVNINQNKDLMAKEAVIQSLVSGQELLNKDLVAKEAVIQSLVSGQELLRARIKDHRRALHSRNLLRRLFYKVLRM
jgi:hypothetical protein